MKLQTSSAQPNPVTPPERPSNSAPASCSAKTERRLWKIATCLAMVVLGTALAGCPQKQDNTAQLQAEVARLKAEADAKTKGDVESAAAKAEASQAAAAANADAAARAQAQTAAGVAQADADVAKAQAEADEAAKAAAAAQTSFVDAKGEADKAKDVVDQAKTEAAASQEAAAEPTATEADVAKAEADANELAVEVAQAEAARLRAELARAKAKAAAAHIQGPVQPTSPFLSFLSTLLNNQTGGPAYALNSLGQIWVPPGSLPSGSAQVLMNQFPPPTQNAALGTSGSQTIIAAAQLTPSPATFNPPVQVQFDVSQSGASGLYDGQMIEVKEWDPLLTPSPDWVSRKPPVWAQVQPDTRFAVATMTHFCTVALFVPKPSDPRVPKAGPPAQMHPTEKEVIAKANAEAKAELAQNKQLVETYKTAAKNYRVALVNRTQQNEVAAKTSAAQKRKDLASRNAKAAAEKKIADLKKRKAAAESETAAIEKQNRHDQARANREAAASQQRQLDQLEARQRMQQMQDQQAQQQRQQDAQQERQQRRQPKVQPTPGFFDQPARVPQSAAQEQQQHRKHKKQPSPDPNNPNNPNQ